MNCTVQAFDTGILSRICFWDCGRAAIMYGYLQSAMQYDTECDDFELAAQQSVFLCLSVTVLEHILLETLQALALTLPHPTRAWKSASSSLVL